MCPEGPEVQRVVDQLQKVVGQSLFRVWVHDLRWKKKKDQLAKYYDTNLVSIWRKGKYIFFQFDDFYIMNHLAMTGGWFYRGTGVRASVHARITLEFKDSKGNITTLDFVDPRRFARLEVLSAEEFWSEKTQNKLSNLGPDALSDKITWQTISDQIQKFTTEHPSFEIKPLLMEQNFLTGIGNIYASEICFLAGVNPFKLAKDLSPEELKMLEEAIPVVMKNSYASGGSTIRTYKAPDGTSGWAERMVYGTKYCKICKSVIFKGPQAGRTTYWCKKCQKW